jgi:hypothetical protein
MKVFILVRMNDPGCSNTATTDYQTIENFDPLLRDFQPKRAKIPFRGSKIFFGCRFGDFILIPTYEFVSPQMCHLRARDKALPPPLPLCYFIFATPLPLL